MNYEEKILKYLVDNYRKSKKDSGDNKINRRTLVKPEKLYKKYNTIDGDYEEISMLNQAVECLSNLGFICCEKETFGTQILCIYLVDEYIQEAEQYLAERCGYVSKDMQIDKLRKVVNKYKNASSICEMECVRLMENIVERKVPKNIDELDDILKAVAFIENNQEELYMREMSMKVYGDSKYFENVILQPVCSMLRKYLNQNLGEGELIDEILRIYHIVRETQKLCIKGKVIINISGKELDISGFSQGIEFHADDLINIKYVKLKVSNFMTIENRTSYLRYSKDDVAVFYLGGYANRYQRDFIKTVYDSNKNVCYMHFGDIDAGGFWIHNNLCEVTGVNFELFSMSVEELQNKEFTSCFHELTDNDRTRLHELKKNDVYRDVVQYMLCNNVKLEQEIVSLELMK